MTAPVPPAPPVRRRGRTRRIARVLIAGTQERLATALGVSRARRTETVVAMLDNNARRAPGYWLQLFLATGIATLGLVLGSTAVVIGGMLVSPLMGPIVELGMGFAVGSSLLVIRAFLRVLASAVGVVLVAAGMTLTLPFHEVTSEIAARTAPTLLDLLVAMFCALAAAYTTVRSTADTTAAAAGTAIGISLVPPLCVSGFGVGTGSAAIAGGAALLFIANFSAILVLAVVSFLLLGYNTVEASALEHDYLGPGSAWLDRVALRAHAWLRTAFGSRYGLVVRLLIPAVFLTAVAVPLSRALDEVAWEVRVRDAVRRILADEGAGALQSTVAIERGSVALRVVVVAAAEEAAELERRLTTRVAAAAGVEPSVVVTPMPDARSVQAALARAVREETPIAPPVVNLPEVERQVAAALAGAWPAAAAGRLLSWTLAVEPNARRRLTVRHHGPPLGAAGEEMLARSLAAVLRTPLRVAGVALPAAPVAASSPQADSAWLAIAVAVLDQVVAVDSATACVTRPGRAAQRTAAARSAWVSADAALRAAAGARAGRVSWADGPAWSIRVAMGACTQPAVAADSATVRTAQGPGDTSGQAR